MAAPFTGRRWPDRRQVLLLRAALGGREEAAAALGAWRAGGGDLDAIDHISYRLLPALYRNLERHGIDDPDLGRLKGIYRRTWYQNRVFLHHAGRAAEALQAAGIETAVLKGGAVLQLHHRDLARRPILDVDLLVPEARAAEAAGVLAAAGWRPDLRPGETVADNLAVLHAVPFVDARGGAVDLHRFALEECCWPGADAGLWARSRPLLLDSVACRTQDPAELLVHICVHGSRGQPERVVHWVVDALAIIQDEEVPLAWEQVVAVARQRRVTLAMTQALAYLEATFDAPVPAPALARLGGSRTAWLERLDYRAQGAETTVYWAVVRDLARFLRLSGGLPVQRRPRAFAVYLQHLWNLQRPSQVPAEGLRRVGRRLRETGFRPWRPLGQKR